MKKRKKMINATVIENDEYFFRDQEMFRADINDEDYEKYQLRKENEQEIIDKLKSKRILKIRVLLDFFYLLNNFQPESEK